MRRRGKRRLCAQEQSEISLHGFVVKRNAREADRDWRRGGMLDFCFENPGTGRLKDTDFVRALLFDHPYAVKQVSTSYCHYGYLYQKRTMFLTTLKNFSPTLACPGRPCHFVRMGETHPEKVEKCGVALKNSIPPALIDLFVDSWRALHPSATSYLLIDVFSGWGSVDARVREKQQQGSWQDVKVFSNDLVDREHTDAQLDMRAGTPWTAGSLLIFAVKQLYPEARPEEHADGAVGWAREARVAVLWHCSTPCETYSPMALCKHRQAGSAVAKTAEALSADDMNAKLIDFFKRVVLGA